MAGVFEGGRLAAGRAGGCLCPAGFPGADALLVESLSRWSRSLHISAPRKIKEPDCDFSER